MSKQIFLDTLRAKLVETYGDAAAGPYKGWAANSEKLDSFMEKTRETLTTGRNRVNIDGPTMLAAFRAAGGKGKITFKALRALP